MIWITKIILTIYWKRCKYMAKNNFDEFIKEKVPSVNIGDECTRNMKIFGANNNLMRHLPEIRDGLKPGERRILYTMYKMGLKPTSNHKKVQAIIGQVMLIHPHGDGPLHKTLTALGQSWTNRLTLIDGYGNFGTVSGDPAAAGRYIEARLSKFAWDCFFEEFNKDIVDMKFAYDNETEEPEFLPSKYPIAVLNSALGIGYGNYTSICAFNFNEIVDLTMKLMDDPLYDDLTIYPDSPTGADIIDDGQFGDIIRTGIGSFTMRGEVDINTEKNILTIKSVPYLVAPEDIRLKILDLVDAKKLTGIKDIQDFSNKDNGVKLEIHLKKEADPIVVLHTLYKKTPLEKGFSIRLKLIEDYEDIHFNLKDLLMSWITFRRETKRRYWIHRYRSLIEKQHMIEAKIYILEESRAEKALAIIKKSGNDEEMLTKLQKEFPNISSLQIDVIKALRYGESSKNYKERYEDELSKLTSKEIPEARDMIRSAKKIDKIIKKELSDGVLKFGTPRQSKVITIDGELKFRNTSHVIVFTNDGLVKKLPDTVTDIGKINEGDFPTDIFSVDNIDELYIFDETGILSKLQIAQLENTDLNAIGNPITKYIPVNGKIISIIVKPNEEVLEKLDVTNLFFIMISRNGIIKKTPLDAFINMKKSLMSIIINNDDVLQSVRLMSGSKDLIVYTDKGYGVRFDSEEIKSSSRMSKGVKTVDGNFGNVVDAEIVKSDEDFMMMITNKGYAKKTPTTTFENGTRTMKPVRLMGLAEDDTLKVLRSIKGDEIFNVYLKTSVEEVDCSELPELPRLSKGKKLIPVRKGEEIQAVKKKR